MKFRVLFVAALALAGCGHRVCCNSYSSYGPPTGVVLSPSSTVANPANEPISASFNLSASERNYSANFHIINPNDPLGTNSCWIPSQMNVASGTAFVMNPTGPTCASGRGTEIDQFTVTDDKGQSTTAYIRAT